MSRVCHVTARLILWRVPPAGKGSELGWDRPQTRPGRGMSVANTWSECGCVVDLFHNTVRGLRHERATTSRRCRTPGDRVVATPHSAQSLDLDPEQTKFSNKSFRAVDVSLSRDHLTEAYFHRMSACICLPSYLGLSKRACRRASASYSGALECSGHATLIVTFARRALKSIPHEYAVSRLSHHCPCMWTLLHHDDLMGLIIPQCDRCIRQYAR